MKKSIIVIAIICMGNGLMPQSVKAQSIAQLLEQLALDYQKLAGLKNILSQMYKGYEVLSKGYNSVKDVSKGNFNLHQVFLDGLLVASPAILQYPRAKDVVSDQSTLMDEYRVAYAKFKQDKHFSPDEIAYMSKVYDNLIAASRKNLDDLAMVMEDNKLRMSDGERLAAIDRIYTDGHGQLAFLRSFNDKNYRVTVQRSREAGDQETVKSLYGIN